ncbi:MAG: histidine kinase [Prolixibacteraceae bacterium]|jgi:LytS/YehU family sensor histidine kinase|nr:histidine kinase [Prolixibacteraceae bacterium]
MNIVPEVQVVVVALTGFVILLVAALAYLIVRLIRSERIKIKIEEKYGELEFKVNSLQLETLESKLNPHLFKNVLNSIQSHAYQTYFALDKLANVLDYILYESRRRFVTPREEIDFALSLIEINKIKLSPLFDLKVKLKIGENELFYDQELLAPLISVDLIENAFKHADIHSPEAFISIVFEFSGNAFSLYVSNKISGKTPLNKSHSGLGTQTLEQRLRIIYKDHYKLERFVDKDIYHAHLKIELHGYKTEMRIAGR